MKFESVETSTQILPMWFRHRKTLIGLVGLAAAFTVYAFINPIKPLSAPVTRDLRGFQPEHLGVNKAGASSRKDRDVTDVERSRRKRDLELLKKQWLTLGKGGENYEARVELSNESARLLLASQESIELIVFLKEHEIGNSVRDSIQDLFVSPHAADARRTLVGLPEIQSSDGSNYRQHWSGKAGMGCPEEEFEAFHAALGGGSSGQEALFGHYQNRVAVEPVETVSATLDELEKGVGSLMSRSILSSLMYNLSNSAPFREIEESLPEHYPHNPDVPLADTRTALFTKWAAVDRQAAFDHLMAHSDRLDPELILPVTFAFLKENVWTAIEWIQEMPEGPHFDIAAGGAIDFLRIVYPDQARQVANQIVDPVAREKAYERIKEPYEER